MSKTIKFTESLELKQPAARGGLENYRSFLTVDQDGILSVSAAFGKIGGLRVLGEDSVSTVEGTLQVNYGVLYSNPPVGVYNEPSYAPKNTLNGALSDVLLSVCGVHTTTVSSNSVYINADFYKRYVFQGANAQNYLATSLILSNIGSGYQVNDVLEVVGGTAYHKSRITVTSVDIRGGITGFDFYMGHYSVVPSANTTLIYITGSAGINAEVTLVFQKTGAVVDLDDALLIPDSTITNLTTLPLLVKKYSQPLETSVEVLPSQPVIVFASNGAICAYYTPETESSNDTVVFDFYSDYDAVLSPTASKSFQITITDSGTVLTAARTVYSSYKVGTGDIGLQIVSNETAFDIEYGIKNYELNPNVLIPAGQKKVVYYSVDRFLEFSTNTTATPIVCGDESSAITTGTSLVTFRMPYNFYLSSIKASLTTAQTSGSLLTVNVKKNGSTVFSTNITFDNTEKTSKTATTPAVLSTNTVSDDDEITIDVTQVGDGTATGLKVYLIGYVIP